MMSVWTVDGIPEIVAGDDLRTIIGDALAALEDGDILAITSKIVSKAEGRQVVAADREEAITSETVNPDASARALCAAFRERFGVRVGVIITDTLGRPWREGQTDVAIGAAAAST